MTLKDFIKNMTDHQLRAFAARCETTPGQIKQVAGRYRLAGEKLALNIERETGGTIRCEHLRPDVDWSYLRGTA